MWVTWLAIRLANSLVRPKPGQRGPVVGHNSRYRQMLRCHAPVMASLRPPADRPQSEKCQGAWGAGPPNRPTLNSGEPKITEAELEQSLTWAIEQLVEHRVSELISDSINCWTSTSHAVGRAFMAMMETSDE